MAAADAAPASSEADGAAFAAAPGVQTQATEHVESGTDSPMSPPPVAEPEPAPSASPAMDPAPAAAPAFAEAQANDAGGHAAAVRPVRRPRRNPARYWTIGAILFAIVAASAGGALWYFGPPGWAVSLGLAANQDQPQLLFYLPKEPERRKLPTGEEYFAFSGRIVNSADEELPVPPIVVELRDAQGRLVFSWITKADKARLKPNEEARVSESRLDIPKNARNLALKFVDGGAD